MTKSRTRWAGHVARIGKNRIASWPSVREYDGEEKEDALVDLRTILK
jgi:hypothetical protein